MYVLESNGHIILIDPQIIATDSIYGIVDFIILTHEHYDHISGVNYWKEKTGAKVICSESCNNGLQNPSRNFSKYFKEFCELQTMVTVDREVENLEYCCEGDIVFQDSYTMEWLGNVINLFETPGHSKGSVCALMNNRMLFSGDSLFKDYPTACGFPGGSKKKWIQKSLPLLKTLSEDVQVFPGHFETFYLKDYTFWEV